MNKKTINDLVLEFPSIDSLSLQTIKGGESDYEMLWNRRTGNYGYWTQHGIPGGVEATWHPVVVPSNQIPDYRSYFPTFPNYDNNDGGYGGDGSGSSTTNNEPSWGEAISQAISMGLGAFGAYATLDMARLGTLPTDAKGILKNIFETNPEDTLKTLLGDIKKLDGIALLDATGKVLGVYQAYQSGDVLFKDLTDGNGVDMINVADFTINAGSLLIKSNIVGAVVSMGWLIIKAELDGPHQTIEPDVPYSGNGGAGSYN